MTLGILFVPQTAVFNAAAFAMPVNKPVAAPLLVDYTLSPIWGPNIQQWSSQISSLSEVYGLHPDFIAAVIFEESNGQAESVSTVGAVGLMGVMPAGPGLEWRPSSEELQNPLVNLRWGVSILAEIVRQSGGDLHAALAAYSGGWEYVYSRVPQEYAASVLDNYGRAIAVRNGISPDIASHWTIAIELRKGNVTNEPMLVLGQQPVSGMYTYGEHIIYDYVDKTGRAYYVRGYAVPLALVVPVAPQIGGGQQGSGTAVEEQLQIRLGEEDEDAKIANRNPRIILACLPSLSRLRGHASTRWFAPSDCPDWHR